MLNLTMCKFWLQGTHYIKHFFFAAGVLILMFAGNVFLRMLVLLMSVFLHISMVLVEDSALLNLFQLMLLQRYLFVILVFGH